MAPVLNTKPLSSHSHTDECEISTVCVCVQLPPVAKSPKTAREASVGVYLYFQFDITLVK